MGDDLAGDTEPMEVACPYDETDVMVRLSPTTSRAPTNADWPPEGPEPAIPDEGPPPQRRNAQIMTAVRAQSDD